MSGQNKSPQETNAVGYCSITGSRKSHVPHLGFSILSNTPAVALSGKTVSAGKEGVVGQGAESKRQAEEASREASRF